MTGFARSSLGILAAAFAAAALWSSPARACAACSSGDPTLTATGEEAPTAGRTRVGLSFRGWGEHGVQQQAAQPVLVPEEETTGGHHHLHNSTPDDYLRELRMDATASVAVSRQLALALTVPLHLRSAHLLGGTESSFGLGDVDLGARVVLWNSRSGASNRWLSAVAGVTVPTAPYLRNPGGSPRLLDMQPGTGAFTPRAGLSFAWDRFPWSTQGALTAAVPGRGFEAYRMGPSARLALSAQYQPSLWVGLRLGVEGRVQGDDLQHGEPVQGTGGAIGYLTPAVLVMPLEDLQLQAQAYIPLAARGGPAGEWPTLGAGLLYDL